MSAWTACFPFLPLIPSPAPSPFYFSFSLKRSRIIGRRFERPQNQIDGRSGACPWHTGLRWSIERTPLCPHPSSLSPNHPVMENVQDGGGESSGWQTCVCVRCTTKAILLPLSSQALFIQWRFIQLSPHLTGLISSQDGKWSQVIKAIIRGFLCVSWLQMVTLAFC